MTSGSCSKLTRRQFLARPPESITRNKGESRNHHGANQQGIYQNTNTDNDAHLEKSDKGQNPEDGKDGRQ